MLYYKNIAKFPITVDGIQVMPKMICSTNHYVHSKYMLRVDKPSVVDEVVDEPVIEQTANTECKVEIPKPIIEKPIKSKRRTGKSSKAAKLMLDIEPQSIIKNKDIEIKSEEVDNG